MWISLVTGSGSSVPHRSRTDLGWSSSHLAAALVLLCAPAAGQKTLPHEPPVYGAWEAPFDHDLTGFASDFRFEAVHMALIPRGAQRGKVLVWDVRGDQPTPAWIQRWSILDVSAPTPVFLNAELELPLDGGDFFCAGHAWTSTGELLVAGGTSRYFGDGLAFHGGIRGGRLVYLWDPATGPMGLWKRQPDLSADRWYPSVVETATGEMLIAGGTAGAERQPFNDYEVFSPAQQDRRARPALGRPLFPGPPTPASPFDFYPRILQLASGAQFVAGMGGASARMDHAQVPGQWTFTDVGSVPFRSYVCSVLVPTRPGAPELVMAIGGEGFDDTGSLGVLDSVEVCEPSAATAPAWNWRHAPRLNQARARANALVLPDRGVLVIGGRTPSGVPEVFAESPELFDGTSWRTLAHASGSRSYHSTAVLLPDGRVLTGGGDSAVFDYQVFAPPYLLNHHPRPRITSAPAQLGYSSANPAWHTLSFAPLPPGETFDHVALIAPGSVTHSFDASTRYVELVHGALTATSIDVQGPLDAAHAPPGFYMLFLVSAAGVPSVAEWVEVR
ncbi:MAG: DUF1929 domain-containing protein [Planctomycetes bacterium]|nr:DUF1929 domain-containing protein [Planctomycetota bacterium]